LASNWTTANSLSRARVAHVITAVILLVSAGAAIDDAQASTSANYISADLLPEADASSALAGGGQVEPSGYQIRRFTRLAFFTAVSPFGIGEQVATNASPRFDVRVFGNLLSVNHDLSQNDFKVTMNIQFANVGTFVDFYPIRKPLRISPGFLVYNGDRIRAELRAKPNGVFTINHTDWFSDNADPMRGTGGLTLGGSGFMLTAGYGRIASNSEKHFSFPFEAGVAFIDKPNPTLVFGGSLCNSDGTNCQPAMQYPGFADALNAQLATWRNRVAPFHVFPIVQAGVAYTFHIRSRIR
jgi:hypothetical protein